MIFKFYRSHLKEIRRTTPAWGLDTYLPFTFLHCSPNLGLHANLLNFPFGRGLFVDTFPLGNTTLAHVCLIKCPFGRTEFRYLTLGALRSQLVTSLFVDFLLT